MLPREHRYPFFQGVPEKNYSTRYFHLRYRRREVGVLRIAVVAGKRVDRLAHERNRAKRVFGEVLLAVMSEWRMPYDLVFYLRQPILTADRDEIALQVKSALNQVGIVQ